MWHFEVVILMMILINAIATLTARLGAAMSSWRIKDDNLLGTMMILITTVIEFGL